MDVKNCRECGRLFNYMGGQRICPACKETIERKFVDVREYVYDHRHASINEISEANDVSVQQLQQWIREERLTFADDSPVGIECENCGAMIKTGRYCDKCKKDVAKGLGNLYRKEPEQVKKDPRERARMRFLDS